MGHSSVSSKIRCGIAGAGNCASALIQGLSYYRRTGSNEAPAGLMATTLGGYNVDEIEIVSAFDVHAGKVGKDLADAIWVEPNNTLRFEDVGETGITVSSGPVLDGIGRWLTDAIPLTDVEPVNIREVLRSTETEILIIYLPVGSENAVQHYVEEALAAGCGVVNCVPVFIASRKCWSDRFVQAGLPILGDDIKSQVGATIVHRALAQLMGMRGVRLDRTYQLNYGGNSDFLNMREHERLQSKKISKTSAVVSQIKIPPKEHDVHIGPSDYIPWLEDRKWAQIRLEGTGFGGAPINIELKLEVWDSPNSAGVVVDAVRCVKLALDRGIGGPLVGPSAYFMKSPPEQFDDGEALRMTRKFINGADHPPDGAGT